MEHFVAAGGGAFRSVVMAVALLATVAPGCETEEPASADPPLTLETFPAAWALAYCNHFYRCPRVGSNASAMAMFDGAASCGAALTPSAERIFRGQLRAIARGRMRFDGVAARRCTTQFASRCGVNVRDPELCPEAFLGAVPAGGTCWASDECEGESYCQNATQRGLCPGRCVPRKARGEPCLADAECSRAGLTGVTACVRRTRSDPTGVCGERVQGATVGVAQPCGTAWVEPGREQLATCESSLFCSLVPTTAGDVTRCRSVLPPGAACNHFDACEGGACVTPGAAVTGGTCVSFQILSAAGEPCPFGGPTTLCNTARRLRCGGPAGANTCQEVSDGSLGGMCDHFLNGVPCVAEALPFEAQFLACQWSEPWPSVFDLGCQAGLQCAPSGGGCRAPIGESGASCDSEAYCASGWCGSPGDLPGGYHCAERRCDVQ